MAGGLCGAVVRRTHAHSPLLPRSSEAVAAGYSTDESLAPTWPKVRWLDRAQQAAAVSPSATLAAASSVSLAPVLPLFSIPNRDP